MSARSSVLLLLLGGCDLAFGVGGEVEPCELQAFDSARATDIIPAFRFSVDWDQRFAVAVLDDGSHAELELPSGTPRKVDLGPYITLNAALSPEGDALLYTSSTEPPVLEGALRGAPGSWTLEARTPIATFVGTPTADVFGPRRVLARMHMNDATVQELEDDNGTWVPVGGAHDFDSEMPPNLTPNGLTAVFTRRTLTESGDALEVYGMTRPSMDEWFGTPVKILANGNDEAPQLLGHCERLYTIHDGLMRRYDR
ncbi:MAG TPA: hypothetical protein VMZ53_33545 [Kofleriaceae bacterium]|nr:hypothetical protein [Kofleriaceae bacterium]